MKVPATHKLTSWITAFLLAGCVFGFTHRASADQQILDDLIVDGSACIGQDCVNGESFGFDTIRIKENNLRIKAQDTSSTASFPTQDWQITFNDSTNGGQNKFSIDAISPSSSTPFTIEAGSNSHALYVDSSGDVGFGTNTPVTDLHVKSGNTPTLRLEQDGSSGFTAQTWDMAGNEANFFIRDATNGSTLPFRIFPGAPSNALTIEGSTGDIGIGTTSPGTTDGGFGGDASVHIRRTDGDASLLIEEAGTTEDTRTMLELRNNGAPEIRFNKTGSDPIRWTFLINGATNDFAISRVGLGGVQFRIDDQTGDTFIGNGTETANLDVSGTLSKGGGSFKIDHPLDPENKFLSHSFVESPDMMNIYNGNAVLDDNGAARVTMPDWFESLDREFRYQLTAIGAASPDLHIAREISGNSFRIAGGQPGSRVSWQVTGVRQDAFAEHHRIQVEEDKDDQRGFYLHPIAHGMPASRGIGWTESQESLAASAVGEN